MWSRLQSVRENQVLDEEVERAHRIPPPKGAVWESPARKCRDEVGRWNESRRDDTGSHAHSSAPENLNQSLIREFQTARPKSTNDGKITRKRCAVERMSSPESAGTG